MAGSCSSSFAEGFSDILKRSAIEEIIGNYYAFDPFLQPGRRGGRELNGHPSEQSISIEHVSNNDPTHYSIPPAVTPQLGSQVRMELENGSPVFVTRPPTTRQRFHNFQRHQQPAIQSRENNQEDFDSFINSNRQEDYPEYPPFLTSEESVRQQQQLLPASSSSKMARNSLPKYVIGVEGEERLDDIFQQPEPERLVAPRQTIFRGQLPSSKRPVSDEIVLDESPFAKRSLRMANYDNNRRYNRRYSRSYTPVRQFDAVGTIRKPYYF